MRQVVSPRTLALLRPGVFTARLCEKQVFGSGEDIFRYGADGDTVCIRHPDVRSGFLPERGVGTRLL